MIVVDFKIPKNLLALTSKIVQIVVADGCSSQKTMVGSFGVEDGGR